MKLKYKSGKTLKIVKAPNGVIWVVLPNDTYKAFVYMDDAKKFVREFSIKCE